jgi:hypothetical protein
VTALRHHNETSVRNRRRHLFGPIQRRQEVAVADKNERWNGYGGKAGTTVDPRNDRLHLPRQSLDSNRQSHPHIDFAKRRIVLMRRMQNPAQRPRQQRLEIAGPGLGDQSAALRALLGRIRASRGVEQRQFDHALGRPPHDLEADKPAHGNAGESEARRRRREDGGGDLRDRFSLQRGRDGDRPIGPQGGDLRRKHLRRAKQAGNKNDRGHEFHLNRVKRPRGIKLSSGQIVSSAPPRQPSADMRLTGSEKSFQFDAPTRNAA